MPFFRIGLRLAVLAAVVVRAAAAAVPLTNAIPLLDPQAVLAAAAEVTTNRYPDADQVLVDDWVRSTYAEDGTFTTTDDEYVKLLTEKGRREAATRSYHFSAHYDTVTVVRAELIKPDGRRVPIDVARGSRVMIETSQMSANIYDPNNKILQVSVPGVEIGDVCHFVTVRQGFKARIPNLWADHSVFEYTDPIRRLLYEVIAPPGLPLRHATLRDAVSNTVQRSTAALPDGGTLHRWEVRDVPQMFEEPNMPSLHTVVQRLLVSTAADWPAISRWYWELSLPRLQAVTPEMGTLVTSLISRAESREARIRRIFGWVSQRVRYLGITTETEAPGYEPHDVCDTFNNLHGVCRDKAALLVAMLRLAGFEAYPVMIHAGAKLDPEVPLPYFNHAVVACARPGGGYDLMDPTDESTRDLLPSYLCNRSYLVAHPRGETLQVSPVVPATDNLTRIRSTGRLDPSGELTLDTRIAFDGINDTAYRGYFARQKPEQRRRFFEGLVKQRLAGAELLSYKLTPEDLQDTEQPLAAVLSCRVRDYPVRGDGLDLLVLPWLSGSVGYANFVLGRTGLTSRRYTLETEVACGADETIQIHFGDALGAARELPPDSDFRKSGVAYRRSVAVTNGVLHAGLRFLLEQPEYPPAEYPTLKASLRDIEYASRQRPTFEPGQASAPDVRVLDDRLSIEVAGAGRWTTTRTWSKQVLTYAGMKKHSEVRIGYNPAWQTVEVVSALVSNANGRVQAVSPAEINVMDAAWAGGAPRYPAGKILVVSLPGVETGSVIRVSIRRTEKDRPFFALNHPFRGGEPVQHAEVELQVPSDRRLRLRHPQGRVRHEAVTNASGVLLRWTADDLPALPVEEGLPPLWTFTPVLLASDGDWNEYAADLRRQIDAALAGQKVVAAEARRLTAGLRDPTAKIRAIRAAVARRIRRAGPSFADLPAGLTPADVTWADGYGHSADRAIVLTAMLRAVGLKAEPVLYDSGQLDSPLLDPLYAVPQLGFMDSVLVAVQPQPSRARRVPGRGRHDAPIYLNDTDQYDEPGTTEAYRHAALTLAGQRLRVDVAEPFIPANRSAWFVAVDAAGHGRISVTNWFSGPAAGEFRRQYREMAPEERSRHYQEMVAAVSQSAEAATPLTTDLEAYPGVQSYEVAADRYAVRDGRLLTLVLPGAPQQVLPVRGDSRTAPLHVSSFGTSVWECRVLLPAGTADVPVLPPDAAWELPSGVGRVTATTTSSRLRDGRRELTLRRELSLDTAVVPPELYPAVLEINRRLAHPSMRTIVAELEP